MVAGTTHRRCLMGKAGKMGNFRRSRGEKPKEDNSLPSQRPTESLF